MESGMDALRLGAIRRFVPCGAGVDFEAENGYGRISFLAGDLLRIRIQRNGQSEPDFSYCVAKADWDGLAPTISETADTVSASAGSFRFEIRRSDGVFTIRSESEIPLLTNAVVSWQGEALRLAWTQPDEREVYGCGEKTGPLERSGAPMRMWNKDSYAFTADSDPLYMCIPFYMALDGGAAHAVFIDNSFGQNWDFAGRGESVASIGADGGVLDVYFFAGPTPASVLSRYTELTGRVPLPPLWAVGYQQSRYAYYPESLLREVASEFRRRRIPCDVLYLDVLYMDRYMNFTWDARRFPDPARMIGELKADGFQTVVILDPGIKAEDGYLPYEELRRAGFYVKNPDGTPFLGPVWPGVCMFPDFTDAGCREWWGRQCTGLVRDGVAGLWNDMNEPEVFDAPGHTMPPGVLFAGEGVIPGEHRRHHNIYGMQMGRATYEGLKSLRPRERAFVLARAGYAGAQRYAATWTGDNVSSWDHLRMCIPMTLNLGLSGQAICGPDVGGFSSEASPELFGRWLQANILFPFCRVHSAKSDSDTPMAEGLNPQEPWTFGEDWEAINRRYIELRYRLLPYLYTVFEEMTRTGAPIVRPLLFDYPEDPKCRWRDDQYTIGRDLLCAPIVYEGATSRSLYLPTGDWYDFFTNERIAGGREIQVDAPLDRLPLFVRAGSAIPMQPAVQHTGECHSVPIEWAVYPNSAGEAEGVLYEDDGATMEFADGTYKRTRLTFKAGNDPEIIEASEGSYVSPRPPSTVRSLSGEPGG